LGFVQGVTEFLPISSSGHLVFFQSLFGLKETQLFFDVMLHLGTLLAVVVFFWKDIARMAQGSVSMLQRERKDQQEGKLLLLIVLATVPTGLMGIVFRDWFESFFSEPELVGVMLLVTGCVLWVTRYARGQNRGIEGMTWRDALLIGVAQGLAIIPGISRSGTTISTGFFRGLDRSLAGRFSFLLSIPAILGATVLEFSRVDTFGTIWITLAGTAVAFCMGLLSLKVLMGIIRAGKLFNFSYYCWGVGLLMIFLAK
jgi:undecaprenyl-diphosphatase